MIKCEIEYEFWKYKLIMKLEPTNNSSWNEK